MEKEVSADKGGTFFSMNFYLIFLGLCSIIDKVDKASQ